MGVSGKSHLSSSPVQSTVILTLQSICICLIRSHNLEYTRHLNIDTSKYTMRRTSGCDFPSVSLIFKLLISLSKSLGTLQETFL